MMRGSEENIGLNTAMRSIETFAPTESSKNQEMESPGHEQEQSTEDDDTE